jgi:hypothetical protein
MGCGSDRGLGPRRSIGASAAKSRGVGSLGPLVSRSIILKIVIAVLAIALVGAVVYLETSGEEAAATTTTTSTTTTTATIAPTTTSSPPTTSTSTTSTTSTTTTTTEPAPMFPRGAYALLVVNGSSQGERLEPTIGLLRLVGYENIRGAAGAVLTPDTTVYYSEDLFQSAAGRLADDLGLSPDQIAPFADAPPIAALANAQLVIYLGGS